ncbi:aldo/keto reductase [Thermogladius calderae 1633]|uniref:Aldo/keto reductase n=1 Tax=Thermogladius calderae (strain DSM 22663 / VKM B-2946 / 1633) TaxID=1184251 RepID=I3TFB9_THEC1|nr:aldo/keto reductase [Thermogladius calderae]AFK51457.1 aldo/keto reductase [Thermogladius calderae 1633]
MRYTTLGRAGPRVSVVGLGFWQAGSRLWGSRDGGLRERVSKTLEKALEHGVNLLDTAETYGGGLSEEVLGEAVRALGRDNFVVASKVAGYRVTRHSVLKGVEGVNRRLGFRVDVIQLHWPPPHPWPVCWAVRGLEEAVARGLAGYYGLSNFPRELLEEALECAKRVEPVSNQVQYSLAYRTPEVDLLGFMRERGLALVAWSPLAKGALAGAREASAPAQRRDRVFREALGDVRLRAALEEVASRRGATMAQVALAWLVAKGAIPIPGSRTPERVEEYAGAAELTLGEEDVRLLDEASSRYLRLWGDSYSALKYMRYIPATLQRAAIALMRGI